MGCVAELVDRRDYFQLITALDQDLCVTRKGCGIARDRDNQGHRALGKLLRLRLRALPRRIEDDGIEATQLGRYQRPSEEIALLGVYRPQSGRARRLGECRDCAFVAVDGDDARKFGDAQRERADAAKEIGHRLRRGEM